MNWLPNMRRPIQYTAAGLIIAILAGCGHHGDHHKREKKEYIIKVEVVKPQRKDLTSKIELAASVEPRKKVELRALVTGVIGKMSDDIDIGRKVKKGEKLIELEVPLLRADLVHKESLLTMANKQLIQAEVAKQVAKRQLIESKKLETRYAADYEFQRLRYVRIASLVSKGSLDQQLGEEAFKQKKAADAAWQAAKAATLTRESRVAAAEADYEVAKNKIAVAQTEITKTKTNIDLAIITAPFDGVITKRWVDPGATIKDPGSKLLTIMEVERVRVLVDIPQQDAWEVNSREGKPHKDGKGDPVVLSVPALSGAVKDGLFYGDITRLSKSLDPVTRTLRCEIEMDSQNGVLLPGAYGTATVILAEHKGVLTVPSTALVRNGSGKIEVFVVTDIDSENKKGTLRHKVVDLGMDDGRFVEIKGGIAESDHVVYRTNPAMREGDRVEMIAVTETGKQK